MAKQDNEKAKPLVGLSAYSVPGPEGLRVDVDRMLTDLVAACKAGGTPKHIFMDWVIKTWNATEVKFKPTK